MAASVPASEAMIFEAYGRVEAGRLFAAAARVAELRERQMAAVRKALAMPILLGIALVTMLWAAGGWFVPVLESVVPPERWGPAAGMFRAASVWLYGAAIGVRCDLRRGRGAGRRRHGPLDRDRGGRRSTASPPSRSTAPSPVPPSCSRCWSSCGPASISTTAPSTTSRRRAAPYARHRIGAIQRHMVGGAGLGRAMTLAGHGFPDPSLVPVIAALDGVPGWEDKLSRFVERWVSRSEDLLRTRAAGLNAALLILVTVAVAAGIDAMFSILQQAGRS